MKPITVGVRVILLNEGKVLLVEHTYSSGWYLPGGGVKKFETLEEAIRRELAEEAGARRDLESFVMINPSVVSSQ